ncbi:MAG: sulfopropanediol 3-dehydrogenase, partial [Clostridia bacterium]|nr:sulfopropanediol 3-dehydrogenase [Clostridia bacterium]
RRSSDLKKLQIQVADIIKAVREKGDMALREFSRRFDRHECLDFHVSQEEIRSASAKLPTTLKEDIQFSFTQIRNFALAQLKMYQNFEVETIPGVHLGQRVVPISSCAAYVPGGRYPLFCSALMSIVPAKVAGVERVVATSPPGPDGKINPATLFAMHLAGADELYCLGGAHAIAALAYGTESIRRVDKIVGPGNKYVTEAKRQLTGAVGIDLIAGPSEVLIIADDGANPRWLAADLLAQAEHDPNARAILISTSNKIAQQTILELEEQLIALETAAVARESWELNGEIVVVNNIKVAVDLANEHAPEHLHLHIRDPLQLVPLLKNYGSLFLGENACVVFSDKAIGTNHILPTIGAARYTGGLSVGCFLKILTQQRLTDQALATIAPIAARLALAEGMKAHATAASIRMEKVVSSLP